MKQACLLFVCTLLIVLGAGCAEQPILPAASTPELETQSQPEATSTPTIEKQTPDQAVVAQSTQIPATEFLVLPTPTSTFQPPTPTYDPEAWTELPVIPAISDRVKEIYLHGLELGNNPKAFSKIGDCGSTPAWFLGDFDRGPRYFSLGEYQGLQSVIMEFQGSYERTSLAAKSGFNASSIFSSLWSNREFCQTKESPIACEYRVHKPAFAFIMLGTNDVWHQDSFEPQMRKIIELSIENGVVPILSTKVDDREGDGSINATIARLANEYQIPLWNFWAAAQLLPDYGLQEDGSHLTWGPNQFDDLQAMQKAWPVRNLTALQVLMEIWQYVTSP